MIVFAMALITLVILINISCFIFGKSWVDGFSKQTKCAVLKHVPFYVL